MIKKFYVGIFLLLVITFFLILTLEARDYPFVGIITEDNVNIRAGYNKNYRSLEQLKKDDWVVVLDKYYNWYKIKLPDSIHCFVVQQYVGKDGSVLVDNLNVRAGAGTEFDILGKLSRNSKVTIVGKENNWYRIKAPSNCTGWIFESFVVYYCTYDGFEKKIELERNKEAIRRFESISKIDFESLSNYSEKKLNNSLEILKNFKYDFPSSKYSGAINERIEEVNSYIISKQKELQRLTKAGFCTQGVVKDLGRIVGNPATHKLRTDGETKYYLKSEILNLNMYIDRNVYIWGRREENNLKYPSITVEKVDIVH